MKSIAIAALSLAVAVLSVVSCSKPADPAATAGAKDAQSSAKPAPTAHLVTDPAASGEAGAASGAVTHLDAAGAAGLLEADSEVIVLDVRTPEEYAAGHLAGAVNINFRGGDFDARLAELEKTKPYLVHCQGGGRSSTAVEKLTAAGCTKVYHLDGGLSAWEKAGQPVEK